RRLAGSQLPHDVVAPAVQLVDDGDGAGVAAGPGVVRLVAVEIRAGVDHGDVEVPADDHRRRTSLRSAGAKLAEVVRAPAVRGAVGRRTTGMHRAGGDRRKVSW